MGYLITAKTYNKAGKPVKAYIKCGGREIGSTDPDTGELAFEMKYEGKYDISASIGSSKVYGKVNTGQKIVLQFKD
jgi:hypothetical protein